MEFFVDGTKLYFELEGQGEPIIFLHGWGGSTDSFRPVASSFAKTNTVLNLDFIGFGKSEQPNEPLCVKEYALQIIALMDNLNIEKATLVAHSFGGRVAIFLSAHFPNRVSRLVLVDSAGIKPRFSMKRAVKVFRYKRAKRKGKDTSKFGSADFKAIKGVMRQTLLRVINQDLTPLLEKIKAPTLIIWGRKDKDTPLYMARRMKKKIENSQLVILENAGHYCFLDCPQRFQILLDNFIL